MRTRPLQAHVTADSSSAPGHSQQQDHQTTFQIQQKQARPPTLKHCSSFSSTVKMRVVIVGGGISGLTLASALEKADIDFVLLESRSLFDPQVGASIAIQASGMRILDQLGAADEIIGQTVPIHHTRQRRSDGSLIAKPSASFSLTEKRYALRKISCVVMVS